MTRGVNLIPADRRAARQRRMRFRRWAGVALVWGGLVLSACVGVQFMSGPGFAAAASELDRGRERVTELNAQITDVRRSLAQAQIARATAEALSDQPDWSLLLAILGQTVREDVVLREIGLDPTAESIRAASEPRAFELQLRGFAQTQPAVSQFVLRLQQAGLFDEVKLLRTGREPVLNTSAITFEITCRIHDGAGSGAAGK